ncbi:heterokaryon incompatibility protein domain-containing protein [Trichoderma pleuroticola]
MDPIKGILQWPLQRCGMDGVDWLLVWARITRQLAEYQPMDGILLGQVQLLHASEWRMADFISDDAIPPYAILSHTWGLDEVTYHDCRNLSIADVKLKAGCAKILAFREQAVRDGLEWVWVDTCCINKSSSAELTEAINSMFRWYTNAEVCHVLLSDVEATSDRVVLEDRMAKSRWFTRGWTLQELLAPPPEKLIFYSSDWTRLGSKTDFVDIVSSITRINKQYLQAQDLRHASVAQKMSWAALHQTSRLEDVAYCLLGLFDINMPMIYGEGNRAFIRLQEAIMTSTPDDHSLFAWGPILDEADIASKVTNDSVLLQKEPPRPDSATCELELFGLLAASPKDFEHSGKIVVSREAARFYKTPDNPSVPTKIGRNAFRLDLPMWDQKMLAFHSSPLVEWRLDNESPSHPVLPAQATNHTFSSLREEDLQMVDYHMAAGSWYDFDSDIGLLSSPSSQHRDDGILRLNCKISDQDDRGISIVFHRLSTDDQMFIQVIPVNFSGQERIESDDITWYHQSAGAPEETSMFSHSMALPFDQWHVKKSPMPDVYLRAERVSIDGSDLFVHVLDLLLGVNLDSS